MKGNRDGVENGRHLRSPHQGKQKDGVEGFIRSKPIPDSHAKLLVARNIPSRTSHAAKQLCAASGRRSPSMNFSPIGLERVILLSNLCPSAEGLSTFTVGSTQPPGGAFGTCNCGTKRTTRAS